MTGRRILKGRTLAHLGGEYQHMSRYEQAIDDDQQALAIEREVRDRRSEAITLGSLMTLSRARNEPPLAIFYGKLSIRAWQSIRGDVRGLEKAVQQQFAQASRGTIAHWPMCGLRRKTCSRRNRSAICSNSRSSTNSSAATPSVCGPAGGDRVAA